MGWKQQVLQNGSCCKKESVLIINACSAARDLFRPLPKCTFARVCSRHMSPTIIYGSKNIAIALYAPCTALRIIYLCSMRKASFGNLSPFATIFVPCFKYQVICTLFAYCNQNITQLLLGFYICFLVRLVSLHWSLMLICHPFKEILLMQIFLLIAAKCRLSPSHPSSGALTVATLSALEK